MVGYRKRSCQWNSWSCVLGGYFPYCRHVALQITSYACSSDHFGLQTCFSCAHLTHASGQQELPVPGWGICHQWWVNLKDSICSDCTDLAYVIPLLCTLLQDHTQMVVIIWLWNQNYQTEDLCKVRPKHLNIWYYLRMALSLHTIRKSIDTVVSKPRNTFIFYIWLMYQEILLILSSLAFINMNDMIFFTPVITLQFIMYFQVHYRDWFPSPLLFHKWRNWSLGKLSDFPRMTQQ